MTVTQPRDSEISLTSISRINDAVLSMSWSSSRFTSIVSWSILIFLNGELSDVTSWNNDCLICSSTLVEVLQRTNGERETDNDDGYG